MCVRRCVGAFGNKKASFLDVLQLRAAIPWLRGLVVSDHRPSTYDLLIIGYKTKRINLYSLTSKNISGLLLDNLTHVSKAKDKWCQQFDLISTV